VAGDTNNAWDVFVRDRLKGKTERVSVGPHGRQANGSSSTSLAAISADGRCVAFASGASNLVDGDTNGASDVFVHDRVTGTTERVSVRSDGTEAHGDSFNASISADGRYVAFESEASDLVPGDTNGKRDVFVHDRKTGTTERVSVGPDGRQADDDVFAGSISGHGRYVSFDSWATNLVRGDTNGWDDAFVRDRATGRTVRVSVGPKGRQAEFGGTTPAVSADGHHVAFTSASSDLVPGDTGEQDIFVRNW
jgi:Tol biopolymer transport system component